jgi:hypothetical protein
VFPVRYELGFDIKKTAFFVVTAVETTNLTCLHLVWFRKGESYKHICPKASQNPKSPIRLHELVSRPPFESIQPEANATTHMFAPY